MTDIRRSPFSCKTYERHFTGCDISAPEEKRSPSAHSSRGYAESQTV